MKPGTFAFTAAIAFGSGVLVVLALLRLTHFFAAGS